MHIFFKNISILTNFFHYSIQLISLFKVSLTTIFIFFYHGVQITPLTLYYNFYIQAKPGFLASYNIKSIYVIKDMSKAHHKY